MTDWQLVAEPRVLIPISSVRYCLTIFLPHGRVLEQCHVQKNRATNNSGLRTWVLLLYFEDTWKRPTFHVNTFKFPFCFFFFFKSTALCFITALFFSFQLCAIKIASSLTLVCAMIFSFSFQFYSCKDWGGKKSHTATVPNLFGTRDWFCGRQFFPVTGGGKWF